MINNSNIGNQSTLNINTIGIGIFLWISIMCFTHLIYLIIEKMLIFNRIPFEISFWIFNSVSTIFYCAVTFIALNYFNKAQSINYSKLYLLLIISIIVVLLVRIIFQYVSTNYIEKSYEEELIIYNINQSENVFLYSYASIFEYLKYIFLGVILWILNNSKK
jgi:FlaA1/EpsC-like NDP-sugar epimerase